MDSLGGLEMGCGEWRMEMRDQKARLGTVQRDADRVDGSKGSGVMLMEGLLEWLGRRQGFPELRF